MKAMRLLCSSLAGLVLAATSLQCSRKSDAPTTTPEADTAPAGATKPNKDDEKIVVTGLSTPESVVHDSFADVYLVANIAGSPSEKDGNGFISKIAPSGEVLELRFIQGGNEGTELHAPKGIALADDATIVVADIDTLRFFDRETGALREQIVIPGSTFLNDVVVFDDRTVLVTDTGVQMEDGKLVPTGTDAVYQVTRDGTVTPILQDPELGNPNGIALLDDGAIRVVTFGSGQVFDIRDGKHFVYDTTSPGQLDGLVVIDERTIWASSWTTREIVRWQDEQWSVVLGEVHSPADFSVDRLRSRLLVPLFTENEFWIVPIELE